MANEAKSYGVYIQPALVGPGEKYWRAVRVRHLPPEENNRRNHIFVDCLDEKGQRAYNTWLSTGWQSGEDTAIIDKPLDEPGTNIPMWKGQVRWAEVKDSIPSDRVENLHSDHPDEGAGNLRHAHSFEIVFQKVAAGGEPPPPAKAIEHYIFFGPRGVPGQRTNFIIAQDYVLRCGATCGFNLDEAKKASRVTIVAGTGMVSEVDRHRLMNAGCEVKRIPGDSYAVEKAFADLPCYQVNWGD